MYLVLYLQILQGDLEHLRLEGAQLQGITLAKVLETVEAIDRYNKTGK